MIRIVSPIEFAPVAPDDDAGVRVRLAGSHVAVIGCGGLGSHVAEMLVRSGVGTLTLIDFDTVDPSNLNRQLYFYDQIGQLKTSALSNTLLRIRADVTLLLHQVRATADNVLELIEGADVVIEAVDTAQTKAMIANVLLKERPDLPVVSASGLAGFDSANDVTTERLADTYYMAGDHTSDVTANLPLLASRVVAAAAHEAHAAVRILLGYPEP